MSISHYDPKEDARGCDDDGFGRVEVSVKHGDLDLRIIFTDDDDDDD